MRLSLLRISMVGVVFLLLFPVSGVGSEVATDESSVEMTTKKRKAAGLRLGHWMVNDLPESQQITRSGSPLLEGYFQKGLDLHLGIESTVGLWHWSMETEQSNPLGGTSRETVSAYLVPVFTSLKFHPFTRPEERFEPFLLGGVGFVLGIEERQTGGGSALGLVGGDGTFMKTGLGFKVGSGFEWRFSEAMSAGAGARYQWIRFFEELAGVRTYGGFGVDLGLTYRFQFDQK